MQSRRSAMQVAERILSFARPEPGIFVECLLITIDVRDATLDDIAGCHRCLDDVAQEGRWLSRLSAPPFDGCRIHDSPASRPGAQIVAVDDRVVGWCDIRLDASPVRRMSGPWAWGSSVSIVGRELYAAACNCDATRSRSGLERIELSVLHENAAARAFYAQFDFQIEGRRVRDWKHDGVYQDSILMAFAFN
ncbi:MULTISPECIES: GNAT family N-acetyltransferase [unclassified Ensifer]|uniref:GNAT family N-acetyltransferase n=1 Tax=unclassified Ensifer TaxID=2633371 RepID=UPI000A560A7A|nr:MULTISPECIES: GNAT family N-acetyltransferase [unclassified Ensifer]MBD9493126.1 GNAT family N-acetyltransferase [Ensifer sp. ENS01]MBD9521297.1 GNAT family N-acetyltransferase [Ensifer sp. ENS02]MBD9567139.1 GNAT family N-acetyltransferase [Ensifer sp. ENS08]